jgi:hypothetical protein
LRFTVSIPTSSFVVTVSRTNELPAGVLKQEETMSNTRSILIWTISTFTAAIFWLGLAGTMAQAANKPDTNAAAAFNKLKTLSGTWEASSERGKVTTSYEVISNGSALAERTSVPGEGEILTVYHLDGNHLVLTHYCTAGNQPHMQAEAYDPAGNQILFDFAGGGSLTNTNAGHMHSATFTFNGPDTFTANWNFHENGKSKFVEKIEYHRVKSI